MTTAYETAQASILASALILSESACAAADSGLVPEDMTEPYSVAWGGMLDTIAAGRIVDVVTVANTLERSGRTPRAPDGPWAAWLSALCSDQASGTANQVLRWVELVKEQAARRRLVMAGKRIQAIGADSEIDLQEAITKAESEVSGVTTTGKTGGLLALSDITPMALERMAAYGGGRPSGIPTGLPALDEATGGLHPGNFIVVAGRPSMGKTALALRIAMNVSRTIGPVAMFSLEMPRQDLVERMACMESRNSMHALRSGHLTPITIERMRAINWRATRMYVDDMAEVTISQMRSRLYRLQDAVLVVVDYLQLMGGRGDSREQVVASISRGLKKLAKDRDIPVMALSQLSRETEKRGSMTRGKGRSFRPTLSDLRESGAIEQDCDVVIGMYRPEYYNIQEENGYPTAGRADAIILKQRNGPTETVHLNFEKACADFGIYVTPEPIRAPPVAKKKTETMTREPVQADAWPEYEPVAS